jgi:hypothetical protein
VGQPAGRRPGRNATTSGSGMTSGARLPWAGCSAQTMNDLFAFLSLALPAVALIAITVVFLRALGPFNLMALWYMPRKDTWPKGVQEEDPRPWDFSTRPGSPAQRPNGTARLDDPPVVPTSLHPSTRPRGSRP